MKFERKSRYTERSRSIEVTGQRNDSTDLRTQLAEGGGGARSCAQVSEQRGEQSWSIKCLTFLLKKIPSPVLTHTGISNPLVPHFFEPIVPLDVLLTSQK